MQFWRHASRAHGGFSIERPAMATPRRSVHRASGGMRRKFYTLRTTVVIPTYNRCHDLRFTCQQLQHLDPAPDEVIICLDGCTDSSRSMLASNFPSYRVIENYVAQGSIPSRDRAFRMATGDLIISLDDDSYPIDPAFITKVKALFDKHPQVGVFTFPEILDDQAADTKATLDPTPKYVRDFPNCAAVMRRCLYGDFAQYPTFFSHAYAESDYSLQLYANGYAVRFEPSLSIRHHFTPKERNMLTRHWLNARNELWSVLLRCPMPYVVGVVPLRVIRQFIFALGKGFGWWSREYRWWIPAAAGVRRCLAQRRPIPWKIYSAWLCLARKPALSLDELKASFGEVFK